MQRKLRVTFQLLLILLIVGLCFSSAHALTYDITDLGTLPYGTYSSGYGINNNGQVVGTSQGNNDLHAFIYSNSTMTDLGAFPSDLNWSDGFHINDGDQAVGYSYFSSGNIWRKKHAYLYSNGTMSDLGSLLNVFSNSVANGINNSGQVVGWVDTSGYLPRYAFLFSNGEVKIFASLDGTGRGCDFKGINDNGQIVGTSELNNGSVIHAILYSNGMMSDLGTLGGTDSDGYGINNSGQVVGYAKDTNGNSRAFLYSNGTMSDLGTLGGVYSFAYAINNGGQVVGDASTASGGRDAFLYDGKQMLDLNDLVSTKGWQLSTASGINDLGQITGTGINPGGQSHAFLLTPQATYAITSGAGTGGTIMPLGTTTINGGGSQTFTINPLTGYTIANVLVDGAPVGAVSTYTFTNVTANHTILAAFTNPTYSISGTVRTSGGAAIAGVKITLSGTGSGTTTTDSNGYYSFAGLAKGSYTVTPGMTGYTFSPSNIALSLSSASVTSQNFTAQPVTYTIAATAGAGGTITPSGSVTVNSGGSQTYAITPSSGYSIANVLIDGASAGLAGPYPATYTFNNVAANHTISATFVAWTVNPLLYTANKGDNTVSVIDTATNSVVAVISVGSSPAVAAVDPAGTYVYVADYGSGSVSVIDTSTNSVIATIAVGIAPT